MASSPNQDDLFAASEADRYFDRNKSVMHGVDWSADLPLRLIALYQLEPRNVLEVGAANGFRVAAIAERYGAKAVAVEPSAKAIADGETRFPKVEFLQAMASDIPLRVQFDLIIVNFVLHWVARDTLLRCVAEIDRLLANGGFLILGDFAPTNQWRTKYHHLPEQDIYTYKQNYSAMFLASGAYQLVATLTTEYGSKILSANSSEQERTGAGLLRKQLNHYYAVGPVPH
jgi:ubiquinone/menaquinone biosynthesis C-methylase UbiE